MLKEIKIVSCFIKWTCSKTAISFSAQKKKKRLRRARAPGAASLMAMHPGAGAGAGAPPASSVHGNVDEYDDFHWDDAAEAELQAIEAAYASASAAAKRRRLPDWTSPSPSPSSRPRYSQSPVSGGSTPLWALTPHTPQGALLLLSAFPFPIPGLAELKKPSCFLKMGQEIAFSLGLDRNRF